jgi:hypothetical protein
LRQENLDGCIAVVPPENISELGIKLLTMVIAGAADRRFPRLVRTSTPAKMMVRQTTV